MSFRFVIPVQNSDLQTPDSNSYCVTRVSAPTEIPGLLKNAKLDFRQKGPKYIIDHFDTFYSVFEASDCPINTLLRAFDSLYESIDKLVHDLDEELKRTQNGDREQIENLANITKMFVYLFVNTIKVIDTFMNKGNQDAKGNKKQTVDHEMYNWARKRKDGLDLMYNVTCLKLENLYDPPVMEEDFANLICDVSYRTIEQGYVKEQRVAQTAFQILGTAIKRYNHALVFPVKIFQIVSDVDYAIRPIAEACYTILYVECGITSIFDVLIKDVAERLMEVSNDTKLSKHFSQLLTDLASVAPKLMLPHLSSLAEELLTYEPYTLRTALLQIIGDIIMMQLSGEGLNDELKETRNELLDFLHDHTHDTNAHVRSKVLQIWNQLKSEKAIPKSYLDRVLERAVDRLDDKSSLVRKSATMLIKSFLEHNPFSPTLTLSQLQGKYDEADATLQEMRQKQVEVLPQLEKVEEEWERISTELCTVIINNVNTQSSVAEHQNNFPEVIATMLTEKKYREAVVLVRNADTVNEEQVSHLSFEAKCEYYMMLLKSYYYGSNRPNDYIEEVKTAEDTVKFFADSLHYTHLLNSAVPKLEEMLMSKTNSDVFEAIDFFVTAYQFKIKGCENGMHKMIYLVWSDKEKRGCVTAAFQKVLFTTDKTERAHAAQVVENLSRFIENLSHGHYSAFEELMKEWVENETISSLAIQVMFERYTKKLPNTSENDSRLALQLLVLSSVANPKIVKSNLSFLIGMGIEQRGLGDPRIFIATLDLLINSVEKDYERASKFNRRYTHEDEIVDKIITNFILMFFSNNDIDFDTVCIKTFNFIYRLVEAPDVYSQILIVKIFERMKVVSGNMEGRAPVTVNDDRLSQLQPSQSEARVSLHLPIEILSRFVYMIGFVAMKEMIYLDIDVYSNIKYREDLKTELKKTKSKTNSKAQCISC